VAGILAPIAALALVSCAGEPTDADKVTRSSLGAVVSQAPLATDVGVGVLERGGNAVDAAVATAFALAVVEPTSSGIGGRTQILIRSPDGEVAAIDATTQVPTGYPVDTVPPANARSGYGMIGIPGTVAGLTKALAEHGTMSLTEVLEPVIALAENGFSLSAGMARSIASVAEELAKYEGSRQYFLKEGGSPYEAGELLVQTDLAQTLRAIAEGGADAFYRGEIADRIARDMVAKGGFVTRRDLEQYRPREALVVQGTYRDFDLIGTYLPAAGANTIEMLQILEHFDLSDIAGTPRWAVFVAQALRLGFLDRLTDLANMGPAEHFPSSTNARQLVSKERAAERAQQIRIPDDMAMTVSDVPTVAGVLPPGHTTHLSVVDAGGGAVALTQSLGPTLGSKVAAPGLGFAYAATMGYLSGEAKSAGIRALGPGDRASSRQSPMMVLRDGRLTYVLGGSGARRILSALVQVVSRSVDQGLTLEEAMAAPRVHVEPSDEGIVYLQMREAAEWSVDDRAQIAAFGLEVQDVGSVGNVSAIHLDAETGEYIGVADPGGRGSAGSPRTSSPPNQGGGRRE
jgi:gamma-glutamyltranspeptidase/glutathione hydrolase